MTKSPPRSPQNVHDVESRLLSPTQRSRASPTPSPMKKAKRINEKNNPTSLESEVEVLLPEAERPKLSVKELLRRQDELDRRATELEAREQALRKGATTGVRANNFPPLPASCPLKPCFYQDIDADIPLDFQKTVRFMFYLWVFYTMLLLVNLCGGIAMLVARSDVRAFERSVRSLILSVPLSYICWFRPVYNAFRNNSSLNFLLFFVVFTAQVALSIASTVGISRQGAVSIPNAIAAFDGALALGFFLTGIAIAQALFSLASIMMLMRVHSLYRGTEGSIQRARAELTNEVLANTYVQKAAATVASEVGDVGKVGAPVNR